MLARSGPVMSIYTYIVAELQCINGTGHKGSPSYSSANKKGSVTPGHATPPHLTMTILDGVL